MQALMHVVCTLASSSTAAGCILQAVLLDVWIDARTRVYPYSILYRSAMALRYKMLCTGTCMVYVDTSTYTIQVPVLDAVQHHYWMCAAGWCM